MKTEFYVVADSVKSDFIKAVQNRLNDGWELHGPLLLTVNSTLVQAMVRKTP